MSICKFVSTPSLIYVACTIHLVRGFFWSQHHRLSLECPPLKKHIAPPASARRHHLLLMGEAGGDGASTTLEHSTGEPSTKGPLPPSAVEEEEYVEDYELRKQREPDEPSPFALFLTDKQFEKFEEKINEEFQFVVDNMPKETPPVWHIYNYKAYMMKAYCMIRIMYEVRGAMKTGNGTCDHLILPIPGDGGSAFIVNYVVSETENDMRKDAKKGLQKMLDQRFGVELKDRYPPLDDVYKVCIAFCGPKAALEYSNEAPPMELGHEGTTKKLFT